MRTHNLAFIGLSFAVAPLCVARGKEDEAPVSEVYFRVVEPGLPFELPERQQETHFPQFAICNGCVSGRYDEDTRPHISAVVPEGPWSSIPPRPPKKISATGTYRGSRRPAYSRR